MILCAFAKIGLFEIIALLLLILPIASMWKLFEKANKPGWAAIIPIYNFIVFVEIIGKPLWWVVLFCIPYLNIIFLIWGYNLLVKSFGKDEAFTVGVILLWFIFLPILAFGDSKYQGVPSQQTS